MSNEGRHCARWRLIRGLRQNDGRAVRLSEGAITSPVAGVLNPTPEAKE